MAINYPSHRNPEAFEQTEVCELCGSRVPLSRLTVAQFYPLIGHRICDLHPAEAAFRSNPSYNDYLAAVPPLDFQDAGVRQPPYGMEPWWEDPLNTPDTHGVGSWNAADWRPGGANE